MSETHTEVLYKDGKFLRRETKIVEIGPLSEITAKTKQLGFTVIPDIFSLKMPSKADYEANTYDKEIEVPVHIGRNNRQLYVAHRCVYYPLYGRARLTNGDTTFDLEKDQEIIWHGERGQKMRFGVDYPGLWMIYSFQLTNHRISGYQGLFFTTNIKGNHYAPCFPNIHNNGSVCMGDVRVHYEGDIQKTVQNIFNEYWMSESNDHLMRDRMENILLFEYKAKKGKEPAKIKWTPPEEFYKKPAQYHRGRTTTVAADMLEELCKIEETDYSKKVGVA